MDLNKNEITTRSKEGGTLSENSKSSAMEERRKGTDLRREESRAG